MSNLMADLEMNLRFAELTAGDVQMYVLDKEQEEPEDGEAQAAADRAMLLMHLLHQLQDAVTALNAKQWMEVKAI